MRDTEITEVDVIVALAKMAEIVRGVPGSENSMRAEAINILCSPSAAKLIFDIAKNSALSRNEKGS